MPSLLKIVGNSVVGLSLVALFCAADAAETARNASNSGMARGRYGMNAGTTSRMPTLPTMPGNTVGNLPQELPSNGGVNNNPGSPNPPSPDNPTPDDPTPDDPTPDEPTPECPDGGVRNSDYTVERCMNDVQACVSATLPEGIASMYNEDLRHAIVNGMGLCTVQIERCVAEVRRDCRNVYRSAADVWIDFNARRVQPEYYTFVLRKTGLTPHQAENTCRLLDKNTYGTSFNAVANSGMTTAEYNQRTGAYNGQKGNVLIKKNPQGVLVNDGNPGVDGARGHYARWDASAAECYIRVAAYNKDTHIKNSWLFGAAGDDQPAEVWRPAGGSFTCNKDLFGFSLMNDTPTVAVVGIGGGTLVGAGIGALAGHGKRPFDCSRKSHREMLLEELQNANSISKISNYLNTSFSFNTVALSEGDCNEIVDLYDRYTRVKQSLAECDIEMDTSYSYHSEDEVEITCKKQTPISEKPEDIAKVEREYAECLEKMANLLRNQREGADSDMKNADCGFFVTLNMAKAQGRDGYCSAKSDTCLPAPEIRREVAALDKILTSEVATVIEKGEKSNMLKSIGTGAAIGAGAGGVATAITALVEHSNINCRLGDGLAQVGLGKAYSIETLRDFYVKWNLHLPDTVSPTAQINDCVAWRNACAQFTNLEDCKNAQVNYRPSADSTTTLIRSACEVSGSACIENYPVARSYGVCE